jgi:DNA (cytosine-5)-methyltransferase 1
MQFNQGRLMKIGSLCTGYGGLDMAVEAYFDAEMVWCAENDKNASMLIQERFNKPNMGDIKQIDWASLEPIDILTAGYPCQPFSHAGYRKGENDERHIWPFILQGISILRPKIIILENVRGHLSLGFKEVLGDLAKNGYDAKWRVVRASDVGAPHQRARLFIIAYSIDCGCTQRKSSGSEPKFSQFKVDGCLTNSNCNACQKPRRTTLCLQGKGRGLQPGENERQARNEHRFSSSMDRQTVPDPLDQGRLNVKFVEYMMGLPGGWVSDLDLSRAQKLKMLGNGVVPQQAFHALQLLLNEPTTRDNIN